MPSSRDRFRQATAAGSEMDATARFCLFGAAPDTPNLGVTALHDSIVAGLRSKLQNCELTVFDFGRNRRPTASTPITGIQRLGAQPTRRVWRPEALWNMRLANRLGGAWNAGARSIRGASAVLDLSAGDSFSDIYGKRRYEAIAAPKHMAADAGVPLVLLPQTYGPFRDLRIRADARSLVRTAAVAWARDPASFEVLRDLLGEEFDDTRHRLGVDVAFGLPRVRPTLAISERVESWLGDGAGPVVGINVSGLLYLDPDRARSSFNLADDYAEMLKRLLKSLLVTNGVRVVLVPHALSPAGHPESDPEACARLASDLPPADRERVCVLDGPYRATEIKDLIARLDWFCGARMHSTIAALSSGVPVAGMAYSPKFRGVYKLCDMDHRIVDLTRVDRVEGADQLLAAFEGRAADRSRLAAALPAIMEVVDAQLESIVQFGTTGA